MKSRDSTDVVFDRGSSGNPFFVAAPTRLTTAKIQVETTETFFWLIECTELLEKALCGEDEWSVCLETANQQLIQ